jgi:hypothetical protein
MTTITCVIGLPAAGVGPGDGVGEADELVLVGVGLETLPLQPAIKAMATVQQSTRRKIIYLFYHTAHARVTFS